MLIGWTERGDRPVFKLVTGVSTGALIAPFAFLGPPYDDALRQVYTGVQPSDIFRSRRPLTAVFNDARRDNTPLFELISRHVDDRMLAEITREDANGRLLLIGTTNLDAQRPVIWNIGTIAASGRPGALDLLRRRSDSSIADSIDRVLPAHERALLEAGQALLQIEGRHDTRVRQGSIHDVSRVAPPGAPRRIPPP